MSRRARFPRWAVLVAALGLAAGCGRVARLPIQAAPGSLALDARGRTLLVAVESRAVLQAWDLSRRRRVAEVPVAAGPVRLRVDRERGRVYALCAGAKRVLVFSLPELKPLRNLLLPDAPAAWAFEPERGLDLYCAPEAGAVRVYLDKNPLPNLETGAQPRDILAQPGGDKYWVANFKGREVVQLSMNEGRVLKRVAVRANPLRLQATPDGGRLYVLCTGQDAQPPESVVQEIDAAYGVGGLTQPAGNDARDFALGALGRRWYTISPAGLDVTSVATGLHRRIKTGRDPRALAVSPDETTVYVACAKDRAVFIHRLPEE